MKANETKEKENVLLNDIIRQEIRGVLKVMPICPYYRTDRERVATCGRNSKKLNKGESHGNH